MNASLLITTRNRARQLDLSLQSITEKNYPDLEGIVWDDSSMDDTAAVVANYPGTTYRKHEHSGAYVRNPGGIINAGHKACACPIIIEQCAEVFHITDCITPLLKLCRPGLVVLARVYNGSPTHLKLLRDEINAGRYIFPDDYYPEIIITRGDQLPVPRVGRNLIQLYCGIERPAPFLWLGAIHRDDFNSIGGYNEALQTNGDGDMAARLWAAGIRFCFSGHAVAFHQEHDKR